MKDRKNLRCIFVVCILVAGIIIFTLLYNIIVIRPRIYYLIDYNINLPNREEIKYKVENLNYPDYLNNYPYPYYYHADINSYVDRDLIDFLKSRIENDIGFKRGLSYQHYLRYFFWVKIILNYI